MPITATRLTSTGTLLVNGQIDEISMSSGSISFNGTSQYLTTPANTAFTFGTGDFTIECWIYTNSSTTQRIVSTGNNLYEFLLINTGANVYLDFFDGTADTTTGVNYVPQNQWVHVAVTRSGTALQLFINGVVSGSSTNSVNLADNGTLAIGRYSASAIDYFSGYISNLRIVKGTAVYTSNFNTPRFTLPSITNTSLLLLALDTNNFIKDYSPNAFTMTNVNTATFSATGPYTPRSSTTGDTQYAGRFDETSAPIVASGLIAYIDAGRGSYLPASSSGTNTTFIRDLTGGQKADAVLNGTVQWVSNGAGNIASYWWWPRSSAADYISSTLAQNYLDFTIVFQPDFTLTTDGSGLVGLIGTSSDATGSDKSLRFLGANGTGPWTLRNPDNTDGWASSATTYYINGVASTTDGAALSAGWNILGGLRTNTTTGTFASPFSYFLGTEGFTGAVRDFRGNIAAVAFYNRQLTAAEQLQNYTYFASRYINKNPAARIDTSQGNLFITGSFDEFTGAPLVDANLVAWLDSAQISSYPGTGSTWSDLSPATRNWLLINSPTYESTLGGMINFVGSSSQAAINQTSLYSPATYPYFSVMMWVRPTGAGQLLIMTDTATIPSPSYHVSIMEITAGGSIKFQLWNSLVVTIATYAGALNTWYHLAITYNGTTAVAYVNGVSAGSATTAWVPPSVLFYGFMISDSTNGGTTGYGSGRMQAFMAYNRGLTADEVVQNYNALKRRYGLT